MSKKASTERVEKRLGGGAWEAGYPLHGILQSKWQANSQVEGQALASWRSSVKNGRQLCKSADWIHPTNLHKTKLLGK